MDKRYTELFVVLKTSKNPALVLVSFLKLMESDLKMFILKNIPEIFEKEIKRPTDKELLALIKPLIPKLENPKAPSRQELLALIRPLIPEAKDAEEISDDRILRIIRPYISQPIDGKDAVVDYDKVRGLVLKELKKDYTTIKDMVLREIEIPEKLTGADLVRMINKLPLQSGVMIDAEHIKNLSQINQGLVVPMGGSSISPSAFRGIGLWSTPPEAVAADGSVTAFTVGSIAPTDVLGDGSLYFEGKGYTFSASTGKITFDLGGAGPTQFVRFR